MIWNVGELVFVFLISTITSFLVTPIIIYLSKKLNAVDQPNSNRKLHKEIKPTLGGLSILARSIAGYVYLQPVHPQMYAIIICALIMISVLVLVYLLIFCPI